MTLAPRLDPRVRAVIFDLDRTLIDSRRAWCYAVEEAILAVRGERITAEPLADAYRYRRWDDALSILVPDREQARRCAALCQAMYARSALKRLLVFDGVGMMLDELRGARVEVGAISRHSHHLARKQIESTGLERFIAVLECAGEDPWSPPSLVERCSAFLETEALLYIGDGEANEDEDWSQPAFAAGWTAREPVAGQALPTPAALIARLRAGEVLR